MLLERLYEAIFVTSYSGSKYSTTLGKYTFSRETKIMATTTASMMSSYTDLSI